MPFLEQNPHAHTSVLCSAADVIISTGLLVMAFFALFTRFSAHCASLFLGVNTKASASYLKILCATFQEAAARQAQEKKIT